MKFLNTILNQYDSVKEKLDELCIDEKALKQMQNCTFLLEQIFDTKKSFEFFVVLGKSYRSLYDDLKNTITKSTIDEIPIINYPAGVQVNKSYLKG